MPLVGPRLDGFLPESLRRKVILAVHVRVQRVKGLFQVPADAGEVLQHFLFADLHTQAVPDEVGKVLDGLEVTS